MIIVIKNIQKHNRTKNLLKVHKNHKKKNMQKNTIS
jgi:hypothetical protein